jgi:beta-galactosidase
LRVAVFSNCDEVQLRLNGVPLGRRRPDLTWHTQRLPHPPFIFDLPRFTPGVLEATGYIGGVVVTAHLVRTPAAPSALEVVVDDLGIVAREGESDVLMAHARVVDAHGTLCVDEAGTVSFSFDGDAAIVGPSMVAAEAGIASIVVRVPAGCRGFLLHASMAGTLGASHAWGDVVDLAAVTVER